RVEVVVRGQAAGQDGGVDDFEREAAGREDVGPGDAEGFGDGAGHFEEGFEDLDELVVVGGAEVVHEEQAVERVDGAEDGELLELGRRGGGDDVVGLGFGRGAVAGGGGFGRDGGADVVAEFQAADQVVDALGR